MGTRAQDLAVPEKEDSVLARFRSGLRWKLAVTGGAVLIAALVVVASFSDGLVGAQTDNGTPAAGSSSTAATTQYPEIVNELAKQLGIDPAKVEAALEQVIGQRALNGGLFGQNGMLGGILGRFERGHVQRGRAIVGGALMPELNDLANFFGESPSSLKSELAQGMTLAQIAQKHGKTTDELKTYLTQQFQGVLDQLINRPLVPGRKAPSTTPATPAAATPTT